MENLFRNIPAPAKNEFFEVLAGSDAVTIERIVSHGHVSPESGWYDQERDEFVVLLKGAACIEFKDQPEVQLEVGDWLRIPAHCRHRVSWTRENTDTVWLAVHF